MDALRLRQAVISRGRVSVWRRLLPAILVGTDALSIYLAFVLAYWLRYSLKLGPRIHERVPFSGYEPLAIILVAAMVLVLVVKGAYRLRLSTEPVDGLSMVFSSATISVAFLVVLTSMLQQYQYSRAVLVYLWVLAILMVIVGRSLFRSMQSLCYRRGLGVRRLLVVGATDVGKMVMQSVMNRRDLGYQLVGFVERRGVAEVKDFGRFRALGTVADIPSVIPERRVDDVIIALPSSSHEEIMSVLALCEQHGVAVKLLPDLFELSLSRVQIDNIAGIPLLDVQAQPLRLIARAVKRATDVIVAAIMLTITLPVAAVMALLIRLESSGPPLLRQERIGMGGRVFHCWKFRTMRSDAEVMQEALLSMNEATWPMFKMRHDPRVTRIGRTIRRWSLDELPQLWNVLVGDMSVVGPRPPLPSEVRAYEAWHHRRLEVKPGLTGMWQVSGRSDLPFDEMVYMDIYYVENWSLALDIKLMLRTVIAVLARQGAY